MLQQNGVAGLAGAGIIGAAGLPGVVISPVGGDDVVTAAERATGVTVTGIGVAGATVSLTWGSASKTVVAGGSGAWAASFGGSEIPTDGITTISVIQTSSSGSASPVASRTVVVDGTPPLVPVIIPIAGDDIVNAAEKAVGVTVAGIAEPGSMVELNWGNIVKTVMTGADGSWRANFTSSQVPADGTTTVRASATDMAGNVSATSSRAVLVDSTPPAQPVIGVVAGDNVVNASERAAGVLITGVAEPGSMVELNWGNVVKTVVTRADGSWAANFTSSQVPADGTTTVRASATDMAGHVSATSSRAVLVNTAAPPAPVINTVAGDNVINAAERSAGVAVSGTGAAGAAVSVTWGGATKSVVAGASGAWRANFAGSEVPADGAAVITAVQTSSAGNISAAAGRAVTVDTTPSPVPVIAMVAGDNIVNAAEKSAGVAVSGMAEAGGRVSVTWGAVIKTAAVGGDGTWSAWFATSEMPADGASNIRASATDAAGNTSALSTRAVVIDTKVPAPPVVYTVAGNNIVNSAEKAAGVAVTGRASANAIVQIAWGTASKTVSANASGAWSAQFLNTEVPADGSSEVFVRQTTVSGNTSAVATKPVLVDTAISTPTIGIVAGDDMVNAAEAENGIVVAGTADAGAIVAVRWGAISKNITAKMDGSWATSFSGPEVPANGVRAVTVRATDAAGNASETVTRSVRVDTVAPRSASIGSITADNIVVAAEKAAGVTVAGTAEANGTVQVTWGTVSKIAMVSATGKWSVVYTASEVPGDGDSVVTAVVRDSAGNPGATAARSVIVAASSLTSPVIGLVAQDDVVTQAEKAAGVRVTGVAAAGSTVAVAWGATVKTVKANSAGSWAASFASSDIPADGNTIIQATANGETSARSVRIQATSPLAPVIFTIAGDDMVNATEKMAGVAVSGLADPVSLVTVAWGSVTKTVVAAPDGSWNARFAAAELPADGVSTIRTTATDAAGNVSAVSSRNVAIDTAFPAPPVISAIAGDDIVNAAEKMVGVAVTGVGVPDTAVTVTWGGVTKMVLAGASGAWTANFTSSEVPVDGTTTISAVQTNVAGNASVVATRAVVIDTAPPPPPLIMPIASDDIVNAAERAAGVAVNGIGVAGAAVAVTWGSATRTVVADPNGAWSVNFLAGEIPADGTAVIAAVQTSSSGNVSAMSSRAMVIDTAAPVAPVINTVAGDNIVNAAEKAAGVALSGVAESGSIISLNWGNATKTTVVRADGVWTTNFTSSEVPANGMTTVGVTATDMAGNVSATSGRAVLVDIAAPPVPVINTVAGDNVINAAERSAGVAVSGTGVAGAAVRVTWGGATKMVVAGASGAWRANFAGSEVPADGAAVISAVQTSSAGNVSAAASRAVRVDTTPPPAPVIGAVAGDNIVNAAERAAGVVLAGMAEPGGLVSLTWGSVTRNLVVSASGAWTAAFGSNEVPADGMMLIRASVTDMAGNVSAMSSRSVLIDSAPPAPPLINVVAGDNIVNAAERAAGVAVSGLADPVSLVTVAWGSVTKTVVAAPDGSWNARFAAAELPADGVSTIRTTATDAAGNVSAVSSRNVAIDTAFPAPPVISAIAGDDIVNAAEKMVGVAVTGVGVPDTAVTVTWGGVTKMVLAGASGAWTANFTSSEVPVDGTTTISAVQTNVAGNASVVATRAVVIDTAPPPPPLIMPIASDDIVNAAERAAGVLISGTAEAGGLVSLTWGSVTRNLVVNATGTWTAAFGSNEVPADGMTLIGASVTDMAGNISALSSRAVVVDTVSPAAPTLMAMSNDTGIVGDFTTDQASVQFAGRGEAGSSVQLLLNGVTAGVVQVDATGVWVSSPVSLSNLAQFSTLAVSAVQFDEPGNGSVISSAVTVTKTGQAGTFTGIDILGSSNDNFLVGSDLADRLSGAGGADVMLGLGGDDVLTVSDASFAKIDGGNGFDTLTLDAAGITVNLLVLTDTAGPSAGFAKRISGIEKLDINGNGANTLIVDKGSLMALSDTTDRLIVDGGSDDRVEALGFQATGATQALGGVTYQVYTNGAAELLLSTGIGSVVI